MAEIEPLSATDLCREPKPLPVKVCLLKPWGLERLVCRSSEYEVWSLDLRAGFATSLHLHRNKHTQLLVLSGVGILFLDGLAIRLRGGSSAHIPAGVRHQILGGERSELRLLELESPPDKYDIERITDSYGRAGKPFLFGSSIISE